MSTIPDLLAIHGFTSPEWIAALLLVIAGAAVLAWRRPRTSHRWGDLAEARSAGGHAFELVPGIAFALRLVAMTGLALVVAGPYRIEVDSPETGLGIDLVLALDTSSSMRALDTLSSEATPHTRLDLAREVVARFASTRIEEGDRVGLVVFGTSAFTHCPLTHDGHLLEAALAKTSVGMAGESTALGDALALAVKRVESRNPSQGGRVVVLLTDGRSNAGDVPLSVAVALARDAGVRVHTVGIGTGGTPVPIKTAAGGEGLRFERHDPDPETLRRIALQTGGRFFEARRSADLAAVYAEIDALERAEKPLPKRRREEPAPEPLLAVAGSALLFEIALARLLRRRLA